MPGIHSTPRLWQGIWAGWRLLRPLLELKRLTCKARFSPEVPTCGVQAIWKPEAAALCHRPQVVAALTDSGATTLFSFWNGSRQGWLSGEELAPLGMACDVALLFGRILLGGLADDVAAAACSPKVLSPGDWVLDLWADGAGGSYDSALQVLAIDASRGMVVGDEYNYAPDAEGVGRLERCAPSRRLLTDEMLELPLNAVSLTTVLAKKDKGRWARSEDVNVLKANEEVPDESWWLPEARPKRECKVDLSCWMWTRPGSSNQLSILAASSADWYAMLQARSPSPDLEAVEWRWALSPGQAALVVKDLWRGQLAPKLKAHLWLVAHRALPTVDTKEEWLAKMGIALCVQCYALPNTRLQDAYNTLPHILVSCCVANTMWAASCSFLQERLHMKLPMDAKFVLLHLGSSSAEKRLRSCLWWRAWRAGLLHGLWT